MGAGWAPLRCSPVPHKIRNPTNYHTCFWHTTQSQQLSQHLPSARRKCARPKLGNQPTNLLFLPMKIVVLGEDLNRRFPTIQTHRLDKPCQRYHSVQRQIMDLNFKLLKHFHYKPVQRQAKSSSKKGLKHNYPVTPGFKGQSQVHLIYAPKKTTHIITECIEINVTISSEYLLHSRSLTK
jgi:hypothetical protein